MWPSFSGGNRAFAPIGGQATGTREGASCIVSRETCTSEAFKGCLGPEHVQRLKKKCLVQQASQQLSQGGGGPVSTAHRHKRAERWIHANAQKDG
eukprot:629178-Pelagomonas_calceolata.AAC.2